MSAGITPVGKKIPASNEEGIACGFYQLSNETILWKILINPLSIN